MRITLAAHPHAAMLRLLQAFLVPPSSQNSESVSACLCFGARAGTGAPVLYRDQPRRDPRPDKKSEPASSILRSVKAGGDRDRKAEGGFTGFACNRRGRATAATRTTRKKVRTERATTTHNDKKKNTHQRDNKKRGQNLALSLIDI